MIKRFSILMCLFPFIQGQVTPRLVQYSTNMDNTKNGSSAIGNCTSLVSNVCHDPSSSVLFDGIIPTLTGLDGNMWASQLLTIHSNFSLAVSFSLISGFVGVRRVEIVLFNCPEWGISVQSIVLRRITGQAGLTNPTVTSCDSLVRVYIGVLNTSRAEREWILDFYPKNLNGWVHIAEVEFYGAGPTCPDKTVITTPTTVDVVTSTSPENTASSVTETTTLIDSMDINAGTIAGETTTVIASNAGAIMGGVISAVLAIITITTVVIIIICFTRSRGKEAFTNFKQKLGAIKNKNMEMDLLSRYNPISMKTSSNINQDNIYNHLHGVGRSLPSKMNNTEDFSRGDVSDLELPSASETGTISTQLYAVVDKPKHRKPPQRPTEHQPESPQSPPQQSVEQMYSVIDKSKQRKPPKQSVQQEVVPMKPPQQSVKQMYSVIDKSKHRKPPQQSVEQMYSVVDKSKHRRPPQSAEQMYSVVDKSKRTKPK